MRDVAFSCDDNGTPFLRVAVYSLLTHYRGGEPLRVNVFEGWGGHSAASKAALAELVARFPGVQLRYVNVESAVAPYADLIMNREDSRWNIFTWTPIFTPAVLGDATGNVIHLDIDMLINDDVSKLFELDLGRNLIACTYEYDRYDEVAAREIWEKGIVPATVECYFNTGVLVFNADACRREKTWEKILAWYRANYKIADRIEQDAWNALYHDRMLPLPIRWNFHDRAIKNYAKWDVRRKFWLGNPPAECLKAALSPSLLHFWGPKKPWKPSHRPYRRLYHAAMSAAGLTPPREEFFGWWHDFKNWLDLHRIRARLAKLFLLVLALAPLAPWCASGGSAASGASAAPAVPKEFASAATGAAAAIGMLNLDLLAVAEGLPLLNAALEINHRANERERRHREELARRGIAEVEASRAAVKYTVDTGGLGEFLFDEWGELYIDRRFVTDEEMKIVHQIEAFIAKWFPAESARARQHAPRLSSGGAGLPVFRGFEDERYQRHDALIVKLVAEFNADKAAGCGGTAAQGAGVKDITPALVKSHMIEESGGNGRRSLAAWAVDPLQVNVPGDWGEEKTLVGLKKPSKRNEGTVEDNIRAAIRYLSRKGFTAAARPAAERPKGFFDGWRKALQRYNGRRDRTDTDRYYSDEYADKIVRRAEHPEVFVPIEIKLAPKKDAPPSADSSK